LVGVTRRGHALGLTCTSATLDLPALAVVLHLGIAMTLLATLLVATAEAVSAAPAPFAKPPRHSYAARGTRPSTAPRPRASTTRASARRTPTSPPRFDGSPTAS